MRPDEEKKCRKHGDAQQSDRCRDAPALRSAVVPRAEGASDRQEDRLVFLDRKRNDRAGERPPKEAGIERVERPRDRCRGETVLVKIAEDQSGERRIEPGHERGEPRRRHVAAGADERVNGRRDESARDRLQRDQRQRRVDQRDDECDRIENRRKVKGPVAAFDRIAETAERACDGLRENSEVDQIPMRRVLDRAQPDEERRVPEAPYPKKSIAHGYPSCNERRCCRYGQMKVSMWPSSTSATLPVSTPVR